MTSINKNKKGLIFNKPFCVKYDNKYYANALTCLVNFDFKFDALFL